MALSTVTVLNLGLGDIEDLQVSALARHSFSLTDAMTSDIWKAAIAQLVQSLYCAAVILQTDEFIYTFKSVTQFH